MSLPPPPGEPQDPGPYGEPQYPPAWGGPAPRPPAYPPTGYGPPGYGPPSGYGPTAGYPASGYPAPSGYGYPGPQPARVSLPAPGWALLAAAVIAVIGSVTPWASVHVAGFNATVHGTDGDGKLTIVLAILAAVMGLLIGIGQGRLWTSIVGLVAAALTVLIALIDVVDITGVVGGGAGADLPDDVIDISYGIWLVLVGGLAALGLSIAAMVKRTVTSPAPRPGPRH